MEHLQIKNGVFVIHELDFYFEKNALATQRYLILTSPRL